ncbi:hypothetical protein NUU61_006267 [Penicillium alfredii]|uniref:Uncharacterized protein n=1 Tax=Penicillium alfredii TaxID=1506179 RepID=A0A9W9K434_9EURO|nr:uncharacterized protein NUU61_006267 [Penicillium alfredii]KAJ5091397.1 hypothetical protein NUU61_006267 [Penicillium alfredii]
MPIIFQSISLPSLPLETAGAQCTQQPSEEPKKTIPAREVVPATEPKQVQEPTISNYSSEVRMSFCLEALRKEGLLFANALPSSIELSDGEQDNRRIKRPGLGICMRLFPIDDTRDIEVLVGEDLVSFPVVEICSQSGLDFV